MCKLDSHSVADPGFPIGGGGVDLVGRAVDPRGGYISKILHVKTKESGPVGGGARRARPPLDPPMPLISKNKQNKYWAIIECGLFRHRSLQRDTTGLFHHLLQQHIYYLLICQVPCSLLKTFVLILGVMFHKVQEKTCSTR